ncbi:MAG: putative glycoside hydrolase [Bacillota bacterium]|nr:putative glycoside hydrolase [Bacillota bacterium]
MSRGKLFTIVILLIAVIALSTYIVMTMFAKTAGAETPTTATAQGTTASASAEAASLSVAEAERLEAERKAAEEAKRREQLAKEIAEKTYMVETEAEILESPSTDAAVKHVVVRRSGLIVDEIIKDDNGAPLFYKVRETIEATDPLGYVAAKDVKKTRMDYIAYPEQDVDYTAFQKHPDFEGRPRIQAKGIFVTISTASGPRFDELSDLVDRTELNAMVIDVKDDSDYMLFHSKTAERLNPGANEYVGQRDIKAALQRAKDKGIYLIARIVTFKSPIYAVKHPERAITRTDTGQVYSDRDQLLWASPHDRTLWEYNIGVAKEAAEMGFDEIQFDYVRFPAVHPSIPVDYRNTNGESATAAIQGFLKQAYRELADSKVYIAADVFGWTATALDDAGIGQHWEAMTNVVDYMCPMIYPSHYGEGNFGLAVPDAKPYETIYGAIQDSISRNENVDTPALLRPWIQDFTAGWVPGHIPYGGRELRAQIQALEDKGIHEWLIWNAANVYSEDGLKKE